MNTTTARGYTINRYLLNGYIRKLFSMPPANSDIDLIKLRRVSVIN